MSWNAPVLATTGQVITSTFWNAQIYDNMLEAFHRLGYAEKTDVQNGITTPAAAVTGLSITVNVAANRKILLMAHLHLRQDTADGFVAYIKEGASFLVRAFAESATQATLHPQTVITPSTGGHTYDVHAAAQSTGGQLVASAPSSSEGAAGPAFLLAADIGPV